MKHEDILSGLGSEQRKELQALTAQLADGFTPQIAGLQASITSIVNNLVMPSHFQPIIDACAAMAFASELAVSQTTFTKFAESYTLPNYAQMFAGLKVDYGQFGPMTALSEQLAELFKPSWNSQVLEMMKNWPTDWWTGDQFFPDNWPQDRLDDVAAMMVATGLPLVGFPTAEIISELLDAHERGDDLDEVLNSHSTQIVDELDAFAADLPDDDLSIQDVVATFRELIANYRDKRYRTIQASAFAGIEHLYRLIQGEDRIHQQQLVERHTVLDTGALILGELHESLVFHSVAFSYGRWTTSMKLVPSSLNRNASAHTAFGAQHNQRNALRTLLLTGNLLCLVYAPVPV